MRFIGLWCLTFSFWFLIECITLWVLAFRVKAWETSAGRAMFFGAITATGIYLYFG